jgi:hypothetical protein
MTPRTPQGEVFCPLLSNSEHSGVPEDSDSRLFQVLGFTPTLGQSRGATQIVVEHDNKIVLPLLVATFHYLNPTSDGLIQVTPIDDDSIFGVMTSNETTLQRFLKNELGIFCHSHVKLEDYILPLTWWKSHEAQFPNVFFMVQ